MEKYINEWLTNNTIKTYNVVLKHLINWSIIDIDKPETFTETNFKRLLFELQQKNKWTSRTYNRYRKNFKVFCSFLIKEWYIKDNPFNNIVERKIDKILPKIYTKEQVSLIKYTLNRLYNNPIYIDVRNLTIIYTYLYTWIRLYELINLKMSDINIDEWYILINRWKWWKDRYVPILDKLKPILYRYIDYRYKLNYDNSNFFLTRFWWVIQHREVYKIIKTLQEKLWFKLTCHMFRHTFATELANNDVNIYNITQILWHSKIDTTKIYLNFNVSIIKNNLDKLCLFS